jgi:hypothetical protein
VEEGGFQGAFAALVLLPQKGLPGSLLPQPSISPTFLHPLSPHLTNEANCIVGIWGHQKAGLFFQTSCFCSASGYAHTPQNLSHTHTAAHTQSVPYSFTLTYVHVVSHNLTHACVTHMSGYALLFTHTAPPALIQLSGTQSAWLTYLCCKHEAPGVPRPVC